MKQAILIESYFVGRSKPTPAYLDISLQAELPLSAPEDLMELNATTLLFPVYMELEEPVQECGENSQTMASYMYSMHKTVKCRQKD